jgi:Toprim domain/CHC2 zinc finger
MSSPDTVHIDFETKSTADLDVVGPWRYASDPTTEVLCMAYAVDDGEPKLWLPGDLIPPEIGTAKKVAAHNFQFERAILTRKLEPLGFPRIPFERQVCTMTLALANALPGKLENAAVALGLPLQKDREGYKLMRKITRPLPRRKKDPPELIRWYAPTSEECERFHAYAKRDVEVERLVCRALPELPPDEQALFILDAIVNQRGFFCDIPLAQATRNLSYNERIAINAEIAKQTAGEITSVDQIERIKTFVRRHGHQIASLTQRSISTILAHKPSEAVQRLLELRRDGAKASVRKLDRLLQSIDDDHRLRGTLRFHGSSTGRWSGRGFQPQNLKKTEGADIDAAVDAILAGDIERIRELGAPLTVAANVSRGIVCAAPDHDLLSGDLSSVEARILAWYAGEEWVLENCRTYDATGDPAFDLYCVDASKAFKRTIAFDDPERDTGKIITLSFGFGGGHGAWRKFDTSYSDSEVEIFKREWRWAHKATVQFWKDLRRAAMQAVHTGQRINLGNKLSFTMENGTLRMTLPKGRTLAYPEARLGPGKFEGTREIYFKDNAKGGWRDQDSWYGTLVENAVQATARDLLGAALMRLESAGYPIVLHIHDEIVAEVPENFGSAEEFQRLMTEVPAWAEGLPIAAKVRRGKRYAKTRTTSPTAAVPKVEVIANPTPAPSSNDDDDNDAKDPRPEIALADLIGEPLVDNKVLCPFHDDHTPSLQIYPDHFHCFVCGAHGDHVDWLMMLEGHTREEAVRTLETWDGPRVAMDSSPRSDAPEREFFALKLWEEAQPIAGTLAARYLSKTRGIDLAALPANIDEVLRFHPLCPLGPGIRHPCLVAAMRNASSNEFTGIHRTALTPDAQKIDRRMLGSFGTVKIWPAGTQLVIGEGLETVLAAATRIPYHGAPLQPAWALLSAGMLERFPVLPGVERLIVLVDYDFAGRNAALVCTDRWQRAGRTVVRLTPKRAGADFNDLVMPEPVS